MITILCTHCGKETKKYPVHVRKNKNLFCNRICQGEFYSTIPSNKTSHWKGGKIKRSGYLYVKKWDHPHCGKQGYIAEHRLVIEKELNRYLLPGEIVHHINEIKTDNRPENLEVVKGSGNHIMQKHGKTWNKFLNSNRGHH